MPGEMTRPGSPSQASSTNPVLEQESILAHVANVDSCASKGRVTERNPYCKYLLTRVNEVAGIALVDSGNTWRSVISTDFARKLNIDLQHDLRPLSNTQIGTAQKGASLKILGETKQNMHLKLGTCNTKFRFRPVVIENLAMPLNIAGPFLKRHQIDQIHSRDCLSINGQDIPLMNQIEYPNLTEKITGQIQLAQEWILPPFSVNHTEAVVIDVTERKMPEGECHIKGSIDFMATHDCHPWLNAIGKVDSQGRLRIGALNTTDREITIPAGVNYGDVQLICSIEERERFPWRLATMFIDEHSKTVAACETKPQNSDQESLGFMKGPTTQANRQARIKFIYETFKLNKSDKLKSEELKQRAAQLILRYWNTFSFDGSFGATDLLTHTIYTEPGPPINQRYRPLNPSLEPHLQKQLDDWLKHDVIEKSNSPYNFWLVCVPKKNGKFRWCVDYRDLNKVSKRDTFPIGNIEDNLARLSNSTVFSGLDGSGAFHVVPLSEDSKEKTAFATPFGLYQFKRLPFGLANGPATYARLIKMVLRDIPTNIAIPYLDDTIIHSRNVEEHFSDLNQVLLAHEKAGLKLQPAKCQLFQASIDYLGHRVSAEGIAPLASHTEVIKTWPMPTNRNELRSFLGKIGYYRRFVKDFAGIARPMTDHLKKDELSDKQTFPVNDEYKKAFQKLKQTLLQAPILAYPKFKSDQPFILDTDWSYDNAAIGAVLTQKQDGLERVIAYGGHKLADSQRNYGPTKGELYAVVYFVNYYKYYLAHRPFILRTDHQSLKHMAGMEPPKGMILRWLTLLSNFEFTIEHRAGKLHSNADSLSRAPHLSETELVLVDEVVASLNPITNWDNRHLLAYQREDTNIRFLFDHIQHKTKPGKVEFDTLSQTSRVYANLLESMSIGSDGLIRYTLPKSSSPFIDERRVYVLPEKLVTAAVMRAHKQIAHRAAQATCDKLRLHAYFPNMLRRIQQILLNCGPCQTKTTRLPDQHHTLKNRPTGYPFQILSLDFVGPFPMSHPRRNKYLLTVKDVFTKWVEAFAIKYATADEVVRILTQEIFPRFGKCDQIHSDQGTQFTGKVMQTLGEMLKIKITQTPAYNPKSNPVERVHREIKAALLALAADKPNTWDAYIPSILYAIRISINRSTGFSPFQLMFGRDPIDDLDSLFPYPRQELEMFSRPEYFKKLQTEMHQAFQMARDNMDLAVSRQRRSYQRNKVSYCLGDRVWLFTPMIGQRQVNKMQTGWSGPWTVIRCINEVTYEIEPHSSFNYPKTEVVSCDRLRKFFDDEADAAIPPLSQQSVSLSGDFFAEGSGPPGQTDLQAYGELVDNIDTDSDKTKKRTSFATANQPAGQPASRNASSTEGETSDFVDESGGEGDDDSQIFKFDNIPWSPRNSLPVFSPLPQEARLKWDKYMKVADWTERNSPDSSLFDHPVEFKEITGHTPRRAQIRSPPPGRPNTPMKLVPIPPPLCPKQTKEIPPPLPPRNEYSKFSPEQKEAQKIARQERYDRRHGVQEVPEAEDEHEVELPEESGEEQPSPDPTQRTHPDYYQLTYYD